MSFSRKRPSSRRRPRANRLRPRPEALEERALLSTVTSLLDNGVAGTLRFEIAHATGGEMIDFAPGLSGVLRLTRGELLIDKSLNVVGPGADGLTISGRGVSRVFEIGGGAHVVLAGLTVADGRARGDGGGIFNGGGATLAVSGCRFLDNQAKGGPGHAGRGGGIFNASGGTLDVTACVFDGNEARGGPGKAGEGGGLYSLDGTTVDVSDSVFTRNRAIGGAGHFGGHGGGAGINAHGRTSVVDAIITDNQSVGGAGAYGGFAVAGGLINENAVFTMPGAQGASLSLVGGTIAGNRAVGGSGRRMGGSAFGAGLLNLAADLSASGGMVTGNRADAGGGHFNGFALGGGLLSIGGTAGLDGTAIVGNTASGGIANDVFSLLSQPVVAPPIVMSGVRVDGFPTGGAASLLEPPASGAGVSIAEAPNLALVSASTPDSKGVVVNYQVQGSAIAGPVPIAIYRSADTLFDPTDVKLGERDLMGADLAPGHHTITVDLAGGLPIDPSHPYVLAVADPGNAAAEADETDHVASFRTWVIGAVAHGLEYTPGGPAWIDAMANSLRGVGYDVAIPFDWSAMSSLPIPGMTVLAGQQLAASVAGAVQQLQPRLSPGDVIDLHLIGHSRGSVVISQAALDLRAIEQAGALPQLGAGWLKMTFLDPHPAHNVHTTGTDPTRRTFSVSDGPIGRVFLKGYALFSASAQDPEVILPANVDDAEVYYQHTNVRRTSSPDEPPIVNPLDKFFVSWGEVPVFGGTAHYHDLTPIVHGHYEVHDWYEQNVVPTLGNAGPPPSSGDTSPPPTGNAGGGARRSNHAWAVYEARVLTPAVFTRSDDALTFVKQLGAAESAFAAGRLEEAIGRGTYLVRSLQELAGRGRIAPGALQFVFGQVLPELAGLQAAFPGLLVVRDDAGGPAPLLP